MNAVAWITPADLKRLELSDCLEGAYAMNARDGKNSVPLYAQPVEALSVLKRLEWSRTYSYCTGWPCCPICKGIKPGYGKNDAGVPPDNTGHRPGCTLSAALSDPRTEQEQK